MLYIGGVGGLIVGLLFGLWVGFLGEVKTFETIKWSWQEARNGFNRRIFPVSTIMIFYAYIAHRSFVTFGVSLLATTMIFAMIFLLIPGFQGSEIQQSKKSNQGIFRSAKNAAIIGVFIFGVFGLSNGTRVFEIGRWLGFGLIGGLFGAITGGGSACIQHFSLRLLLYHKKYAPWNYARFLDYATERLFLQKVGGGYIFVHRMLLEHFAEMSLEQKQR
jgi:hypothetical protein